jgi:hypothetical protein
VKIEGLIFAFGAAFYGLLTVVYVFMTREIIGTTVLLLTSLLAALIGFYVLYTAKRVGSRPEDRNDAEIDEAGPTTAASAPTRGGRCRSPWARWSRRWAWSSRSGC